ncbi:uncharacterized protein [Epargyreus clarus]|uniref:uncharacterized protein n=1 Tax=Epargyreus clarus TaxID=520877 RepID=UPI003C2FCC15
MKCGKVKNPCKICFQSVSNKTGLQCKGACKKWAHYKCLNYTPGKISDIKAGIIKVTCPCPDCSTSVPKEILTDPPYTCNNQGCPATKMPVCESNDCPSKQKPIPQFHSYPTPPRPATPECQLPPCVPPEPTPPCTPPRCPTPPRVCPTPPRKCPTPPRKCPTPPRKSPTPPKCPTPPKKCPTPPRVCPTPPRKYPSPPRRASPQRRPVSPPKRPVSPPRRPVSPPRRRISPTGQGSPPRQRNARPICPPCPKHCPKKNKGAIQAKEAEKICPPQESRSCSFISTKSSDSGKTCYEIPRSSSSDSGMTSVDPQKKVFCTIEEMCNTVGQLSDQLNELMCKMMTAFERRN